MVLRQIRRDFVECRGGGKGERVSSVHDAVCLPCPSNVVDEGKGFRFTLAWGLVLASSLMSQVNVSNL